MMGYWMYQCDSNHLWGFYRDVDAAERPEDATCSKCGEEAVILKRCPMVKEYEIVIRDAGQIMDEPTSSTSGDGMYVVWLRNREGEIVKTSKWMTLDQAVALVAKVAPMSDRQLERYIRRLSN